MAPGDGHEVVGVLRVAAGIQRGLAAGREAQPEHAHTFHAAHIPHAHARATLLAALQQAVRIKPAPTSARRPPGGEVWPPLAILSSNGLPTTLDAGMAAAGDTAGLAWMLALTNALPSPPSECGAIQRRLVTTLRLTVRMPVCAPVATSHTRSE